MSVSVHGVQLTGLTSLSGVARGVLRCIDQGVEWTEWAIRSPQIAAAFASEVELLMGVQMALHNQPLTVLRRAGILVSPRKLSRLAEEDLETLARLEAETDDDGAAPLDVATRRLLSARGLWSQQDLAPGQELLTLLGVDQDPIFQALSLSDEIALAELANRVTVEREPDDRWLREAARWAVRWAVTPVEYADYVLFFLRLAERAGCHKPKQARRRADRLRTLLTPLLFVATQGPQLSLGDSLEVLMDWLRDYLAAGGVVGFPNLAAGCREVVTFADPGSNEITAEAVVRYYLQRSSELLATASVQGLDVSQDGAVVLVDLSHGRGRALLALEPNGALTLLLYEPEVPVRSDDGDEERGEDGEAA